MPIAGSCSLFSLTFGLAVKPLTIVRAPLPAHTPACITVSDTAAIGDEPAAR